MKLIYGVKDKLPIGKTLLFAFQQIMAIMAATLVVPIVISTTGLKCDPAAALFGAGAGTIIYLILTKFKSPVFLGSSFTFLGALTAAASQNYGYWGLIIGVLFAALVYAVIAVVVKFVGTKWLDKLMPPIIIGPILAIIGLSLSGTATGWAMNNNTDNYNLWSILCALFTFMVIVVTSVKGKKGLQLIPFIIGIAAGFVLALIITGIGHAGNSPFLMKMRLVDFAEFEKVFSPVKFTSFFDYPKFTFLRAIQTNGQYTLNGAALGNLALLFIPIAVVELAQHLSDHKTLSTIVESDLLKEPGLHRTLLGDGIGSAVGAFFGGCANTTYGESISCVALTKNASTMTILFAGIGAMLLSFFTPFIALINTLPKCVIGGACIALYGFISVCGLNMLKDADLNDHRNLYPVAAILVIGVGGLTLDFGTNKLTGGPAVQLTPLAVALIVGIITNIITHLGKKDDETEVVEEQPVEVAEEVVEE